VKNIDQRKNFLIVSQMLNKAEGYKLYETKHPLMAGKTQVSYCLRNRLAEPQEGRVEVCRFVEGRAKMEPVTLQVES
jgi:hypothetical protein